MWTGTYRAIEFGTLYAGGDAEAERLHMSTARHLRKGYQFI